MRWMNVMLAATSMLMPMMAFAAHPQGHAPVKAPEVVVVPEEVVLATNGVATALERFRTGAVEETAGVEDVISALDALARANAALEGVSERVVIAAIDQERQALAIHLAMLLSLLDPGPGERLGEATTEWLESQVPTTKAGIDGPTSPCIRDYAFCLVYCSFERGFVARALCGLDCDVDLAGCLNRQLRPGGQEPIETIGSP